MSARGQNRPPAVGPEGGWSDHQASGINHNGTSRYVTVGRGLGAAIDVELVGFDDVELSPYMPFNPLGMGVVSISDDVEITVMIHARRKRVA